MSMWTPACFINIQMLTVPFFLNPFRKNDIPQAPEFTIGMLIASARAGRWLYD